MQINTLFFYYVLLLAIFAHFDTTLKPPKLIRAQLIIEHPKYWKMFLALKPIFEQYGLFFVTENPDVIFCNRILDSLPSDVPIIILERKASGSLWDVNQKNLGNKNIKAIFKNRIFRDKNLYNEENCIQSFHFKLINNSINLFPTNYPPYIDQENFSKIRCVLWSLDNSPCSKRSFTLKKIKFHADDNRPIDVFFAGRIEYTGDLPHRILYSFHRKQALKELKKIKGINILFFDSNKALSFEEYIEATKKSKIVVSPWGTGEWAHRDYEAIHCGAVLLKPDTGFLQAIPDIYQNNITYVPCKADFSDLEDKIHEILSNYRKYTTMRKRARKLLLDYLNLEKIAYDFVKNVRKVLAL